MQDTETTIHRPSTRDDKQICLDALQHLRQQRRLRASRGCSTPLDQFLQQWHTLSPECRPSQATETIQSSPKAQQNRSLVRLVKVTVGASLKQLRLLKRPSATRITLLLKGTQCKGVQPSSSSSPSHSPSCKQPEKLSSLLNTYEQQVLPHAHFKTRRRELNRTTALQTRASEMQTLMQKCYVQGKSWLETLATPCLITARTMNQLQLQLQHQHQNRNGNRIGNPTLALRRVPTQGSGGRLPFPLSPQHKLARNCKAAATQSFASRAGNCDVRKRIEVGINTEGEYQDEAEDTCIEASGTIKVNIIVPTPEVL